MSDIDVIIPAFNAAAYLGEAIDSVLAQTHAVVARIIVVDDGSTDDTASVAQRFGTRVELIRQANRGISAARNAALAVSDAPFIAFLDADDRWTPDKLERQCTVFARRPETDYVLCHLRCFASPELPDAERAALEAKHEQRLAGWSPPALLIRRNCFDRVGPFAEDLPLGEVMNWFDRARVAGLVGVMLEETLVERRLHRHNTTRRQLDYHRGYLVAAKRHLDRLRAARNTTGDAP